MFPGIDGFAWDTGHVVFLGAFYAVLFVIVATMVRAMLKASRDLRGGREDAVRWHADFEDLPASLRRCRHELSGEVASRVCENSFDCRRCADHPGFLAARAAAETPGRPGAGATVAGLAVPAGRLYHRGHTWVRPEADGTLTVGLDDLGARLMRAPDRVELPPVGRKLVANGIGWRARKDGVETRVLAPVDGVVTAVGGPELGWYLKVRPDGGDADTRHLLDAAEARPWMLREVERLELALAAEGVGAALADGGVPVEDLAEAVPPDRLDAVCGMVFLEP